MTVRNLLKFEVLKNKVKKGSLAMFENIASSYNLKTSVH